MRHLVVLAILCCAGVLLADTPPARDDWSPIVYPAQRVPLVFSHQRHLARGTTCAACHPGATTSRAAADNLIPTERECRACHQIDRAAPDARCATCHPGYTPGAVVARVYLTPAPLTFAHAAHVATPCAGCHGDLTRSDHATRTHLPTMTSCLACHKDGAQVRRCADCHLARLGGLLEVDLPHGQLIPRHTGLGDGHGPGFARDHRQEASQVGATCAACHDRSTCVACHQGVAKPFDFHPSNYVLGHAVEARRGTPDCGACHRAQSFCVACHERTGVGLRGPTDHVRGGAEPARAFHPPGWATSHGRDARRNVTTCASCHREPDCLGCHSADAAGLRISPHPPGWRGSARCRALDRANRRMCLKCHVTRDEHGCDW
jgi:hypothetical protein